MKKGLTELVFILDRSGSMTGLESDTIGGFNAVLKKHQECEGDAVVSTVLFDNVTEVLHDRVNVQDVQPLTRADYQVRGCTALLDAVGGAIRHIERVQRYMPDEYKAEHVAFVITTDGLENASRRYTYDQVKHAIERKQEEGWEFLFMGANIDAAAEAARIGIRADRAATYVADTQGTNVVYEAMADATCCLRAEAAVPAAWAAPIEHDRASRKA
ncbi:MULTISPECIES: VWA domain-containing protein [unclassified Adlercreutzia]|uniref:vWA domain-containing protein n=1 Tax=unclassified Adlercreutzia TaxID=2636013 RepID=UPI0013EA6F00|nr:MULTISPECIES: VWA domain-containing protein [unclassified Adlercreutzia]